MRSEVEYVTCDHCGKTDRSRVGWVSTSGAITWWRKNHYYPDGDSVSVNGEATRDWCSFECLCAWFEEWKMKLEEDEAKSAEHLRQYQEKRAQERAERLAALAE